ncbi:hypothetical protein C8R45DRAFT_941344 [Mycena sanguinolenta]|nr:hypothetical protein C8R45DRAFT_941344 [Mycena sanguinolenta]
MSITSAGNPWCSSSNSPMMCLAASFAALMSSSSQTRRLRITVRLCRMNESGGGWSCSRSCDPEPSRQHETTKAQIADVTGSSAILCATMKPFPPPLFPAEQVAPASTEARWRREIERSYATTSRRRGRRLDLDRQGRRATGSRVDLEDAACIHRLRVGLSWRPSSSSSRTTEAAAKGGEEGEDVEVEILLAMRMRRHVIVVLVLVAY